MVEIKNIIPRKVYKCKGNILAKISMVFLIIELLLIPVCKDDQKTEKNLLIGVIVSITVVILCCIIMTKDYYKFKSLQETGKIIYASVMEIEYFHWMWVSIKAYYYDEKSKKMNYFKYLNKPDGFFRGADIEFLNLSKIAVLISEDGLSYEILADETFKELLFARKGIFN